ncbi:hypothetical protein NA57DRAFT_59325 [Rhizodiscina lignyota]|uniref:Uncharacterized protein n=1 Tax=Rhizodiscina lignyota TaxID=1504668 RepID=A0A9P4M3Z4_9PEZI|nr:hypothetical protein NA57DRAFT_59325 [Rhizodiscina lignyota]
MAQTEKSGRGETSEGPSEQERREEASKTAKAALAAQQKAKELTQAAAGAGDSEERQKLLNEAIQKEVEAGSLGKTANYLMSGSFQGLIAGSGIGSSIGIGLGTLTGTIVGGVTALATGGLGAGIGAGWGALRGPIIKLGDVAGEGVKKLTGTIPGWDATDEQKETLEKMIGEVHDQDRPSEEDLTALARNSTSTSTPKTAATRKADQNDNGSNQKRSWTKVAKSTLPSSDSKRRSEVPGKNRSGAQSPMEKQTKEPDVSAPQQQHKKPMDPEADKSSSSSRSSRRQSSRLRPNSTMPPKSQDQDTSAPKSAEGARSTSISQRSVDMNSSRSVDRDTVSTHPPNRPKPRKLERRGQDIPSPPLTKPPKRKPRKLEVRQ